MSFWVLSNAYRGTFAECAHELLITKRVESKTFEHSMESIDASKSLLKKFEVHK